MKRFPKILAATCAALALSSSLALAAETPKKPELPPMPAGHGQMGPMGHMGLASLPPEKQEAALKLMAEHRAALFPLHQGLYAKHLELEALNASGAGVTDKTKAVIRDIAELNSKMLAADAAFRAKVFKATGLRTPLMGHGPMGMGGMGGMGGGMKCGPGPKGGQMGGQMGGMMGGMQHGALQGPPPASAPEAPAPEHDAHN